MNISKSDLKADLKVLEAENQFLLERTEESLLLQLVNDLLSTEDKPSRILEEVLERIAVFLDIELCAALKHQGNHTDLLAGYAGFTHEPLQDRSFEIRSELLEPDPLEPLVMQVQEGVASPIRFHLGNEDPTGNLVIIPGSSEEWPSLYFLFFDRHMELPRLEHLSKTLNEIVNHVLSRLDNISLQKKLAIMNKHLEELVEERSRALQVSEQHYRNLFETSIDAICLVDASGNFSDLNPAAEKLLGLSRSEAIGKQVSESVHPEDMETSREYFEKLHTQGFYQGYEGRLARKDGEIRHIQVNSIAIQNDGEFQGSYDIIRDITDQVEAREKLATSLAEKEVLLREVQHRTKNNMNVIIALLNMQAQETANPDLDAVFRETRERIQAMALVYDQLQLSGNPTFIDLKSYIQSLSQQLYRSLSVDARRIKVETDCESIPITLNQSVPIGIILNEILTNAFKYAFPEKRKGHIRVATRLNDGQEVELLISDDGIGISGDVPTLREESLGLRLVDMLAVDQLKGCHELATSKGVQHRICFKLLPARA